MKFNTLIDGNSVGHAAQHGFGGKGKKLVAGGQETTAIFGMIVSVQKMLRGHENHNPIILWDGRSWRYNDFEDYKGNRTNTADKVQERERYRSQRHLMFKGLHMLGMTQLVAGNMEADDMAAILTRKMVAKGESVKLITGDKDWLQLVQPGVTWIDHKQDRKCAQANFQEFTGFRTPAQFVDAKGLQGDSGDNIKPKTGIGESGAKKLLAVFDSVEEFLQMELAAAEERFTAHHGTRMHHGTRSFHGDKEAQDRFRWALKMMDLNHPEIPKPIKVQVTRGNVDVEAFKAFCGQHAFMSLMKDIDRFVQPFKTMEQERNT